MSKNKDNISRRDFLGTMAGVGVASVASTTLLANNSFAQGQSGRQAPPPPPRTASNTPTISVKDFKNVKVETDVLVIGSGIAGVFAAVKAHDAGAKVHIVSKGCIGRSGMTPFGKGVFIYDEKLTDVSKEEFLRRIAASSLNTNNPVFTKQLLDFSLDRVNELQEWGFFDSNTCGDAFMKPLNDRKVSMNERVMITHLLKENGRVVGAAGFSIDENIIYHFHAKTTILCTGAGAFKPNGFPMSDLTHDGTIMAYKIGAKVTGKEWNDGHPASAINSGSAYDNWHGQVEEKPSINSVGVNHHLGVNINYAAYKDGAPIERSSTSEGGPFVPEEFRRNSMPPMIVNGKVDTRGPQGPPPGMASEQVGGSTAGMAIHKSEGILPVNAEGLSTLPGLYAAGDALGSYLSGGIYTQIGSSMSGSAVQGTIAGEAAARDVKNIKQVYASASQLQKIDAEILAPITRTRGYSTQWVIQVLQGIMIPNFVIYIQKESIMNAALAYVDELYESHVPMLVAKDLHGLRLAHETENMIISAQMKLKASLMRKESRCSHYRLDYPKMDTKNWNAWINIYQDNKGNMKLEKQAFTAWPKH